MTADEARTIWQVTALPISEIKALKLYPAKSSVILLSNFSAVILNKKKSHKGRKATHGTDKQARLLKSFEWPSDARPNLTPADAL